MHELAVVVLYSKQQQSAQYEITTLRTTANFQI